MSMNSVVDIVSSVAKRLWQVGIENEDYEARLLVAHALGLPSATLYLEAPEHLSFRQGMDIEHYVERRCKREPLSKIVGEKEFWSLPFKVSKATLDPRPDSETLIEAVLEYLSHHDAPLRFLDIGTGSGCLLLAALQEYPESTGVGVDISPDALKIARYNADALGMTARTTFLEGSWTAPVTTDQFDVILSNPPYIATAEIATLAPEVREFDPMLALDGGEDGLEAYRQLMPLLGAVLQPEGYIFLEIGYTQQAAVEALVTEAGLEVVVCKQDLAGNPRCVVARKMHPQTPLYSHSPK
jgi:release factor glutamine methyltransferase